MNYESIKAPIIAEFALFQQFLDSAFSAEEQLLKKVLDHVRTQKGKQVRPVFTLLCAKLCAVPNNKTINVAAAYELLHTASLIHDDVVDNTMERRGQPSANALFDNRTAVLVGDYLLSKSMQFIAETGVLELYTQLALLGNVLTRGELLQLQHSYSIPTEEDYIEIIKKKTAVLFTISAESAAISVGATTEQREALRQFAEYLGICFQIKDDIFDYTPNAQIGKPTLNDIREGKFTLPLIHALESIHANEASLILDAVKKRQFTEDFFYNIGSLVARTGGIEYAEKQMEQYRQKAIEALSIFADSEIKQSLLDLLAFTIQRKK